MGDIEQIHNSVTAQDLIDRIPQYVSYDTDNWVDKSGKPILTVSESLNEESMPEFLTNPLTGKKIKSSSAASYDKDSPVYRLYKSMRDRLDAKEKSERDRKKRSKTSTAQSSHNKKHDAPKKTSKVDGDSGGNKNNNTDVVQRSVEYLSKRITVYDEESHQYISFNEAMDKPDDSPAKRTADDILMRQIDNYTEFESYDKRKKYRILKTATQFYNDTNKIRMIYDSDDYTHNSTALSTAAMAKVYNAKTYGVIERYNKCVNRVKPGEFGVKDKINECDIILHKYVASLKKISSRLHNSIDKLFKDIVLGKKFPTVSDRNDILKAIHTYQQSSTSVNKYLRTIKNKTTEAPKLNVDTSVADRHKKNMNKTIHKLIVASMNFKLPTDMHLYRGTYLTESVIQKLMKKKNSAYYMDGGFLSTTLSPNMAYSFAPNRTFNDDAYFIVIDAKKGTNCLPIKTGSGLDNEDEVVFPPNTKFKVTRIDPETQTIYLRT